MNEENKNIGLIIADDNEIHKSTNFKLIKSFNDKFNVNLYRLKNLNIYVINSGIGLTNASMKTQYLIDIFKVSQIWNYGAVGATNLLKIYDLAIPKKFYYFDVVTPWYKFGQIPNENEYYLNSLFTNKEINIASGNSFVTSLENINNWKKEINIDLFDMESCAIAQVCSKNNIPFYCIKSVSDIIGDNNINKEDINKRIQKSSKFAFEEMIKLLLKNI